MRTIVTGGAGFIGSNLVDALLERGDEVAVIDNLASGKRSNLEQALTRGAALHEVDIRDGDAVRAVFAQTRPELVFHLAAQVDVRVSVAQPTLDAGINILGTIELLEAARVAGVQRFVNTSTGGGIYGDAERIPTPEPPPIGPMAPYGQSKLAAEGYCELYTRLHGLSTVSLRYGNVYGPRQDVHGEAGVVAIFCGCLLDGRPPVVFGDGGQTRDWIEVSDVVRANLLAAGSDVPGAVNIGWGTETSVRDLLEALGVVGREYGLRMPDPQFAAERLGEVRRSCLDVSRARDALGFSAEVELEPGVRRIIDGLL
jgi:UDP-glucose 4-epimerase